MGIVRASMLLGMFAGLAGSALLALQGAWVGAGWTLAGVALLILLASLGDEHGEAASRLRQRLIPYAARLQPFLYYTTLGAGVLLFGYGQWVILRATAVTEAYAGSFAAGFANSAGGLLLAAAVYYLNRTKLRLPPRAGAWVFGGGLALGFCVWAGVFIFRSSVLLEQGRYFVLFDDAMISLRYAWNLTHGLGLAWNPGERVEGYTNLLMTLYMAVGTLFLDKNLSALFTQISGIAFLLLAGLGHARMAERLWGPVPEERKALYLGLAFASPLIYYPLAYWSLMGMETGLLCLLVSASLWLAFKEAEAPRFNPWLAVLLGLMPLVRPDAAVQAGLILLYRVYTLLAARRSVLACLAEGAIFAAFPLAQLGFRLGYYGEWYPNTYTLKIEGFPLEARLAHGKKFVLAFLASAWPAILAAAASLLVKYKKEKLLLLALFLSVNVYEMYVGGDPWPYWRIMAPYLGMLLILALDLFEAVLAASSRQGSGRPAVRFNPAGLRQAGALAVWLALAWGLNSKFLPELYFQVPAYTVEYNIANLRIGLTLARVAKPEAKVGVFWAGTIPYYSGLPAVDFLGKSDKHIARLQAEPNGMPGHNKYDLHYSIQQLQPDYIQGYYWEGNDEIAYVQEHYEIIDNLWYRKQSPRLRWDLLKP